MEGRHVGTDMILLANALAWGRNYASSSIIQCMRWLQKRGAKTKLLDSRETFFQKV
jgi:hypothetical protein